VKFSGLVKEPVECGLDSDWKPCQRKMLLNHEGCKKTSDEGGTQNREQPHDLSNKCLEKTCRWVEWLDWLPLELLQRCNQLRLIWASVIKF